MECWGHTRATTTTTTTIPSKSLLVHDNILLPKHFLNNSKSSALSFPEVISILTHVNSFRKEMRYLKSSCIQVMSPELFMHIGTNPPLAPTEHRVIASWVNFKQVLAKIGPLNFLLDCIKTVIGTGELSSKEWMQRYL